MDDLFRFLMLRAAKPNARELDRVSFSEEARHGAGATTPSRLAAIVKAGPRFVAAPGTLALGDRMTAVAQELGAPPFAAEKVRAVVGGVFRRSAAEVVGGSSMTICLASGTACSP